MPAITADDCSIKCNEPSVATTYSDMQAWYQGTWLGYRGTSKIYPIHIEEVTTHDSEIYFHSRHVNNEINYLDPRLVYALPDLGLFMYRDNLWCATRRASRQWRKGNREDSIHVEYVFLAHDRPPPNTKKILDMFYNNDTGCLSNRFHIGEGGVYHLRKKIGQVISNTKDSTGIKLYNPLYQEPIIKALHKRGVELENFKFI